MTTIRNSGDLPGARPVGQDGQLWELVRDVGVLVDGSGRVAAVSPSVEASYGHRAGDLIGRPLVDVVHPDSRVTVEAYLSRPDLADPSEPSRLLVAHADGSWVPTLVRLGSWDVAGGGVAGIKVMLRPVEGSVDGALAQERAASERLQLVDEMKHRLLEAVSHELRTPLTIIGGFAETLQRDGVDFAPARLQQVGASIDRQAVRLQRIVSDLMDLDRVSRGVLLARGEQTDLASAAIEVVEQVPLGSRQLNLELERVSAVVDRAKFDRIVECLLVNARRHTPPDTTVWVRLTGQDGGVVLEVADNGPGMPDDLKTEVFSPFAQGRLLDPSSPGLGLGLALVHRFAQLHGGRAWVEDRDGGGARFLVFLPADGRPDVDVDTLNSKLAEGRAHERAAFDGPTAPVQLRPEALGVVNSVLRTVRRELDMTVAYLSAFTDTEQVVLAVDGDGAAVGVRPGGSFPIEDTYCVRMIRGEVGNLIIDTAAEPRVANLPSTDAGLACYAGVPVRLPNGQVFGSLCCADPQPRNELAPSQVAVLRTAAGLIGDHVGHRQLLEADQREITRRIEQVLSRPDSLRIVYQPIVDVTDGHVAGVEALSRFPDADLRPPDVWFADAEQVGLSSQLEQITVLRALQGLRLLPDGCYLSLNLSPATVISGGLRPLLGQVPADRIVIEITEHAGVSDYDALRTGLRPFRSAGARLAIDDVGSGFASLRHVLRLSPDIIKIDRSLVNEVTSDPAQRAIAIALAELGTRVGTKVVAEGVEDQPTLDVLRDAGITHAQGWLFERAGPLPLKRSCYRLDRSD